MKSYTITTTSKGEDWQASVSDFAGPRDRCQLSAVESCAHAFMRSRVIPLKWGKRISQIARVSASEFEMTVE